MINGVCLEMQPQLYQSVLNLFDLCCVLLQSEASV